MKILVCFESYSHCAGAARIVTRGGIIPRAPKSPNNVTSIFFNTCICFRKTSGSNKGGAKLTSCPGRHLTSLRPWVQASGGSEPEEKAMPTFFIERRSVQIECECCRYVLVATQDEERLGLSEGSDLLLPVYPIKKRRCAHCCFQVAYLKHWRGSSSHTFKYITDILPMQEVINPYPALATFKS